MTDATIGLPTDGAGKLVDAQSLSNSASQTVYRQTVTIGDPSAIGSVQAVKAASTAAGATDPAAVVGLSPNSPLPAGTNALGSVSVTGSVAVTGTFYPATQPVSIAASVGVTGTFWQTTQPVSLASAPPGQRPFEAAVTITRPANTTAYTNGQLISTAVSGLTALPTLALGVGNSQRVIIKNVSVISSNGAASVKGAFAVYLFGSASPSGAGFNDASSFAPTAAALGALGNALMGLIPNLLLPLGSAAYAYILSGDTREALTDASGNLYVAIAVNGPYTPASAETLTLVVSGVY
jgi:hypothetical protein